MNVFPKAVNLFTDDLRNATAGKTASIVFCFKSAIWSKAPTNQKIAVASISTRKSLPTSAETSTSVAAGRCSPK